MKKRALVGMVALLVMACSPTRWTWRHAEGLGPQELQEDTRLCDTLSREEANYWRDFDSYATHSLFYREPYSVYRSPFGHRHYDPFWYDHGWYPESFSYYRYLSTLVRVCMRAKGWQQVPLTEEPEDPLSKEGYGP